MDLGKKYDVQIGVQKRRLTTILIGLTFLTSCDCYQRVAGTVIDKASGRPLQGVTVYNKSKEWCKIVKLEREIKLPFIDSTCVPKPDILDNQQVYLMADKNAEFPGGKTAFFSYLQKNLRYPKEQAEWQGSIYVTFIVDSLGNIRNECIYKRYFKGEISPIEKVALNLIKEMPTWSPAEKEGKKVYMRITLPVKF